MTAVALVAPAFGFDALSQTAILSDSGPDNQWMLFLHSGGRAARTLAATLRQGAAANGLIEQEITMLEPTGFRLVNRLLEQCRGRQLVALIDDAQALALETVLFARATPPSRRLPVGAGNGASVLLTATL